MADENTNPPTRSSTTPEPTGVRMKMPSGTAQPVEAPTTTSKPQIAATTTSKSRTAALGQPQSSGKDGEPTGVSAVLLNEAGEVEAEDDTYSDSGVGTEYNSDSTSITSSVYAGFIENGRRYQNVREGEYWGPSDEKQFESMHAAHLVHLILDSRQKNELFHSPIPESAQNILDIGTGDGAWAQAVADRYPSALVQGIDLYPPPDTWVPPNCKFEVDDCLEPWMFREKFDLIHLRWMLGAFTDSQWDSVYQQAYKHLLPGGWIEQVEPSIPFHCDDNTLPVDSKLAGWGSEMTEINAGAGKGIDTMNTMRARIEAAGFINIHEKLYKVPTGDWAKDKIMKEAGRLNLIQFKQGMEGYVIFVLTRHGGWTPEEVQVYLAGIRKELDARPHVYQFTRRIWAQKPADAREASASQD